MVLMSDVWIPLLIGILFLAVLIPLLYFTSIKPLRKRKNEGDEIWSTLSNIDYTEILSSNNADVFSGSTIKFLIVYKDGSKIVRTEPDGTRLSDELIKLLKNNNQKDHPKSDR